MSFPDQPRRGDRPKTAKPLAEQRDDRLRCPKDATIMERVRVGGDGSPITVDRCASCGAIWFDALELSTVLNTRGATAELDTGKLVDRDQLSVALGGLVCPRDRSPLRRTSDLKQQHIVMDTCATCGGVLLDAGELTDLSVHTLREKIRGFLR